MTAGPRVGLLASASLALALAGVGVAPAPCEAAAQAVVSPVLFGGRVIDTWLGEPVPGALIVLDGTRRRDGSAVAGVTDDLGRFEIPNVPPGPSHVRISRLGYVDLAQVFDVQAGQNVEIAVVPKPVLLEGIEVYVDRLAERIAELPYMASTFTETAIGLAPDLDVASYLDSQPGFEFVPCFDRGLNAGVFTRPRDCIRTRGAVVQRPRIYVDDAPAFGGVRELATLPTTETYRIEVIRGCAQIRVYTVSHVEGVAARPGALTPIVC